MLKSQRVQQWLEYRTSKHDEVNPDRMSWSVHEMKDCLRFTEQKTTKLIYQIVQVLYNITVHVSLSPMDKGLNDQSFSSMPFY